MLCPATKAMLVGSIAKKRIALFSYHTQMGRPNGPIFCLSNAQNQTNLRTCIAGGVLEARSCDGVLVQWDSQAGPTSENKNFPRLGKCLAAFNDHQRTHL